MAVDLENFREEVKPHKPLVDAPARWALQQEAEKQNVDIDYILEKERGVQYAATDSKGNIYLCQNPAAWKEIIRDGKAIKIKPKPILYLKKSNDGNDKKSHKATPL